ncbi:IstB-like ATP binding protein, partial [Desulfacinum infernum DSM 9756]
TRFVTCYGLVNELVEARQERLLQRLIQKYVRYDLLILDELGYIPFSKEGSELLFQVLAERHEKGSVIITTNLGFADWTQVFGDPTMTAALLDRLTHRAYIINCSWESYRLKQSLKSKGGARNGLQGGDKGKTMLPRRKITDPIPGPEGDQREPT